MKKQIALLLAVGIACLLSACTSYPPGATKAEIWETRYNNVFIVDDDSTGLAVWKVSKHVFWDVFTLCFAEIHYARIDRNYNYWQGIILAEKRQKEADEQLQKYCKTLWGKNRSEAIAVFGPPDEEKADGNTGKILKWEQSVETLNSKGAINLWTPIVTTSYSQTLKQDRYIIWFCVDHGGIITGSGVTRR